MKLSQWIAGWINRGSPESRVNRDELVAMARIGHREGVFNERESTIIHNLVHARNVRVADVLTPRTVVEAVPETTPLSDLIDRREVMAFSRIPVYSTSIDEVTGYALKHEVLEHLARDEHDRLVGTLKREIPVAFKTQSVIILFENMMRSRDHIAKVVDEYGGLAGIITLEDLIETLIGDEITDESDPVEDLRDLARKKR